MNYLVNQLFLAAASTGGDPVGKLTKALEWLKTDGTKVGLGTAVVMLVIVGIMFLFGGRAAQIAKSHVVNIFAGIAISALAAILVPWIAGLFA